VDVKSSDGPPGGGHRVFGRSTEMRRRQQGRGYDHLHVAVDDHSRVAFVQVHPDERGPTAARFVLDAAAFFAEQGVKIERVRPTGICRTCARLPPGPGSDRGSPPPHPDVPSSEQREGGAVHPDPETRVGLQAPLPLKRRAAAGPARVGPVLVKGQRHRRDMRFWSHLRPVPDTLAQSGNPSGDFIRLRFSAGGTVQWGMDATSWSERPSGAPHIAASGRLL